MQLYKGLQYQKQWKFYVTRWEKEAIKYWMSRKETSVAWVYFVTSNVSIQRNLLNKVGGFDTEFQMEWL